MKPIEKSIYEYFCEYADGCGTRRFLFDEGRSFSVRESFSSAVAIGNRLHRAGIGAGSFVALRCTRSLDTCLIYLALEMMGATAMLTDPHRRAADFLADAGVRADFTVTNEKSSEDISAVGGWEIVGRAALEVEKTDGAIPEFSPAADLHAPATVVFTSGSTGKGKGVVLSQYNLVNHIRNFSVSGCYFEDDVSAELLPIHHVFGLAVILMGLIKRYEIFFPHCLETDYIADCIERHRLTRLDGVPSFALALAQTHQRTGFCAESLRVGVLGGAPSTKAQFDFIERELGIMLLPVYGQSECIGISGADEAQSAAVRSSTVGKFLPMNEGFLLKENGKEAEIGEEGEICVRGPAVMSGYLSADGECAIDGEGRLHTGDLGYLDRDGNLHITGRKKDIVIRNGNNISTARIEAALLMVEGIAQAAVVGVADERQGEVPCALVVPAEGYSFDAEGLKTALRGVLPKNEIPEAIAFAAALPLNGSGKTDKQKIKEGFLWKA